MKKLFVIGIFSVCGMFALSACGKPKPVGSYQALECKTICAKGECQQQCVNVSGDYYKK
ncbi:hypothetical protein ACRE1S_06865 [Helicobacter himalayensis]|uniref:hypothetical protein n=1 Tax=Helicobacter himalayensis TaxID=1591088 RepID=UPI003D6EF1EE